MTTFYCLLTETEGDFVWQEGETPLDITPSQFFGKWDGKSSVVTGISGSIPPSKGIPFLGWPQISG